ncbi:MAG: type II toxin-antitoxin system VapC family toxin [Bacteroidetes bacterium]|nr:type II toxin-antitoxin system VapC family toxin [Bacteroidota bacterium]
MKVLVDTNILIHLFKGDPKTEAEILQLGIPDIYVPSVAAMELYRGMSNKKEMAGMVKKLAQFKILHFDEAVSTLALAFIQDFKLSHELTIPDAVIGAMAVEYGLPLHTYNLKDFRYLPGIVLYQNTSP